MDKGDIDFFTAGDIVQDFSRINKIIASGIFKPENALHPLVKSALTEVMVCLNDLTHKASKYGSRISITEDVLVDNNIKDVTDLIRFIRDAMCHIHIYHHFMVPGLIKASFFTLYGKLKHVRLSRITASYWFRTMPTMCASSSDCRESICGGTSFVRP